MPRKAYPAKTPEAREQQLINLAVNEAERRLQNGTASSQIITTLLNLGSIKAKLELERMRADIELSKAKERDMEAKATNSDLYSKALEAFRSYKGAPNEEYDEEE